jgi:hypothetical protein
MPNFEDRLAATRFARACEDARAHLRKEMEARGLHESDGWKIVEIMRPSRGGSELVLRPLHLHRLAPPDLECVVAIDGDAASIDVDCTPER